MGLTDSLKETFMKGLNKAENKIQSFSGSSQNQTQSQSQHLYPQQQYHQQQQYPQQQYQQQHNQQAFQYNQQPQQSYDPHQPPPPPVPYQTRPNDPIHFRPKFQQDIAVTTEWDAKKGNGPDGWGNHELQHYTDLPQNSFHTPNGQLVIRALANSRAPIAEQRFTSARLVSKQTLAHDRGCLTAIIQSPCARGIWPAFWLLPKEPFAWPTDGEIDIAETWNGDEINHSCLHWGQHSDPDKHRVMDTHLRGMSGRPARYDFVWDQPGGHAGQGRLAWYIDKKPVMSAQIPPGTRPMRDMTILLNVAMGGDVCKGELPADGYYDMVVHSLYTSDAPEHLAKDWEDFEKAWRKGSIPAGKNYHGV